MQSSTSNAAGQTGGLILAELFAGRRAIVSLLQRASAVIMRRLTLFAHTLFQGPNEEKATERSGFVCQHDRPLRRWMPLDSLAGIVGHQCRVQRLEGHPFCRALFCRPSRAFINDSYVNESAPLEPLRHARNRRDEPDVRHARVSVPRHQGVACRSVDHNRLQNQLAATAEAIL